MDTPFRREAAASLDALAELLPGEPGVDVDIATLTVLGDALRLGLETPRSVRGWWKALRPARLSSALVALRAEAGEWVLPARFDERDDPHLDFVVRRRDQVESVRAAVIRACVSSDRTPASLDGFLALSEALAAFDARLGAIVDRSQIGAPLVEREALHSAPSWIDALPPPAASEEGSAPMTSRVRDAVLALGPSSEVVTRFLTRGTAAVVVEGAARRDAAFADELEGTFDDLDRMGEPLSLVAWRWRKRREPAMPVPLAVRPLLLLTGDDGTSTDALVELPLGELAPVRAEGRVLCTATTITLRVYAAPGDVSAVSLGDVTAERPGARGVWEVSVPTPGGPIGLRVEAPSGEAFAVAVEVVPERRGS